MRTTVVPMQFEYRYDESPPKRINPTLPQRLEPGANITTARQARTAVGRGAGVSAGAQPDGVEPLRTAEHLRRAGHQGTRSSRVLRGCRASTTRAICRHAARRSRETESTGGVSNRTVCAMLTILSSALTTAMKRGLVAHYIAQLVDRPAIEHREMSTWTTQQVERFREHIRGDRLYACWLLTLTGLRRSEVRARMPGRGGGDASPWASYPPRERQTAVAGQAGPSRSTTKSD